MEWHAIPYAAKWEGMQIFLFLQKNITMLYCESIVTGIVLVSN
jgi:hypothetical protein